MPHCLHGRGGFEEVKAFIEDALRGMGRRVKPSGGGRIVSYKISVFSKITLIYYWSDGSFQVCGPRDILEALRKRAVADPRISFYEPVESVGVAVKVPDEITSLLMRRQWLSYMLWRCRVDLVAAFAAAPVAYFIISMYNPLPEALIATLLFTVFFILAPKTYRYDGKLRLYHVLRCPSYRWELGRVDNILENRLRSLPPDSPYREIIAMQLRGRRR